MKEYIKIIVNRRLLLPELAGNHKQNQNDKNRDNCDSDDSVCSHSKEGIC